MTKELGVWKAEECALVLVDYQQKLMPAIRYVPKKQRVSCFEFTVSEVNE